MIVKPRYHIVSKLLPVNYHRLLDYGGGNGGFVRTLAYHSPKPIVIDVSDLPRTEHKTHIFVPVRPSQQLPFADASFDVVTLLEVLEHVPDETNTLEEIARVLQKDGCLLLTVPHKGFFSWLDPGDFKFKFPWLHKILYILIYGGRQYKEKFDSQAELFGDISRRKTKEHHHYSLPELSRLLEKQFTVELIEYFGLFFPLLSIPYFLINIIFHHKSRLLEKAIFLDSKIHLPKASFYIAIKAIKKN